MVDWSALGPGFARLMAAQIRLAIGRTLEVDQNGGWLSDTDAILGVMAGAMAGAVVLVEAEAMFAK